MTTLFICLHLAVSLTVFCWLVDEHELTHAIQLPTWVLCSLAWPLIAVAIVAHACWVHCRRVVG